MANTIRALCPPPAQTRIEPVQKLSRQPAPHAQMFSFPMSFADFWMRFDEGFGRAKECGSWRANSMNCNRRLPLGVSFFSHSTSPIFFFPF